MQYLQALWQGDGALRFLVKLFLVWCFLTWPTVVVNGEPAKIIWEIVWIGSWVLLITVLAVIDKRKAKRLRVEKLQRQRDHLIAKRDAE